VSYEQNSEFNSIWCIGKFKTAPNFLSHAKLSLMFQLPSVFLCRSFRAKKAENLRLLCSTNNIALPNTALSRGNNNFTLPKPQTTKLQQHYFKTHNPPRSNNILLYQNRSTTKLQQHNFIKK
jgi:hypothetical protein